MSQRVRIQNKLLDVVRSGDFREVAYDPESLAATEAAVRTPPASLAVNEVRSTFEVDGRFGRSLAMKRGVWQFHVEARWDREVALDRFESDAGSNSILIPADEEHDQVLLILANVTTKHPVRQAGERGTEATIAFDVLIGRMN